MDQKLYDDVVAQIREILSKNDVTRYHQCEDAASIIVNKCNINAPAN